MFKKNPYIFFKELINNSYSEDLSESVTRLALGWTQEKDYKLECRLYYAVGSNVKFNTTYYRFNGNVHCYNELPLQLPERKSKLRTLASEKGFIKVKKKWFWKFFFHLQSSAGSHFFYFCHKCQESTFFVWNNGSNRKSSYNCSKG